MDSPDDFPNTPEGEAARWNAELTHANKQFEKFHTAGDDVVNVYRDKLKTDKAPKNRLNLFHANITTLMAMLYGRVPQVDVDRMWADPNDDVARVASEMTQRMLNLDIQESGETYSANMRAALSDRLLPGLACARVRYCMESEEQEIPPEVDDVGTIKVQGYKQNIKTDEWVEDLYVPWKDVRWSPCRFWSEVRWLAFRSYMDKGEVTARFGEDIAKAVPYTAKSPLDDKATNKEVWSKCEVWEIWCKKTLKVHWFVFSYDKILDTKSDPLQLDGFWPMPMPMLANITTTELMPIADYTIAQDLYRSIDVLQDRIQSLTEAAKVAGAYDKAAGKDLSQILKPGVENKLVPVDNWAMFAEKGGIKGCMDFIPLDQIVQAIEILSQEQAKKIEQLYQITGMSDIMRGASDPRATATQDSLKAKFSSVRVQALQDEFARFATDLQKLKFCIIAKHFDPQTIMRATNVEATPDAKLAEQAVALIKDPQTSKWRIQIRSESLAMVDYAQIRQERTEYINALGLFLQSAAPIAEQFPAASPVLLELLKWGLAGFKGSNQIEGVIDQAIAVIKQSMQQSQGQDQKPDPKVQAEQLKQQGEAAKQKLESEATSQKFQMQMAADAAKHQQDMEKLIKENQIKLSEFVQTLKTELMTILAQRNADLATEAAAQKTQELKNAQKEQRTGSPNA